MNYLADDSSFQQLNVMKVPKIINMVLQMGNIIYYVIFICLSYKKSIDKRFNKTQWIV